LSEVAQLHRAPMARMQPQRLFAIVVLALANSGLATEWSKEVAARFVEPHTRQHVQEVAGKQGKPVMVIAMTTWCAACSALRSSVNTGTKVNSLLDKFVVAYAPEEGLENVWTEAGQNYVPQVYFYSDKGKQLGVFSESPQYKYYFADEVHLETAMLKALELMASGTGAVDAAAPPGEKATSPAPDPAVAVFDPAHAFDDSISGHFLANMPPEEIRAKAVEANRPFMVMLTTSWCHACKDLIESINGGKETKDLLNAFVCLHAHGDKALSEWQPKGEDYVPQVLFFDVDGSLMDVNSKSPEYKHFFSSDSELGAGMAAALDASKAVGEL